jgi:hypothetical protein
MLKLQRRCHDGSPQKVEDLDIALQTPWWMYLYKRWSSLLAWFWWSINQWNHTIPLIFDPTRKDRPGNLQIQPLPLGKMSSYFTCTSTSDSNGNVSSLCLSSWCYETLEFSASKLKLFLCLFSLLHHVVSSCYLSLLPA